MKNDPHITHYFKLNDKKILSKSGYKKLPIYIPETGNLFTIPEEMIYGHFYNVRYARWVGPKIRKEFNDWCKENLIKWTIVKKPHKFTFVKSEMLILLYNEPDQVLYRLRWKSKNVTPKIS